MTRRATLRTSLGDVRQHTRDVFEEIAAKWPIYFAWGIGGSGEHKEGRALDFMTYADGTVKKPGPIRVDVGQQIADYLWSNRSRLGVWYVIYRRRIISIRDNGYGKAGTWHPMSDRGDPTANHMDHVHVSFTTSPPAYKPPAAPATNTRPQPEDHDMTPEQAKQLAEIHNQIDTIGSTYKQARLEPDRYEDIQAKLSRVRDDTVEIKDTLEALTDQLTALALAVKGPKA